MTDDLAYLEARIDQERAELSRTVAALAGRARHTTRRYAVILPVSAVLVTTAAALLVWWRRRR